jgi:pyrimidine deaminase RibD-like protein
MLESNVSVRQAIKMAASSGGERASHGPFPRPICGAVLFAKDGRILGKGRSNYAGHAVEFAFQEAGISATPLREWCVAWPSDSKFRKDISESTLYVTLEPSNERQGEEKPPITQLIEMANIPRLVIGCQDPVPESAAKGAGTLHAAGVSVTMGVLQEDCQQLIEGYAELANTKLQRMARQHMKRFGRPLGHLHCSVIDSHDAQAFARNGNSFGKNFGGKHLLSYRDFGTYEIAPPPESIWASEDTSDDENTEDEFSSSNGVDDFFNMDMDFEEEDEQENLARNPMMPWYEQVDACVATFPKAGNGPVDDPSMQARLKGLIWLATGGKSLPAGVERILVMDATDLNDLPLTNDDPNLPPGVDVEEFWKADGRKPSRVLLRHGDNAVAIAVAQAAAKAAAAAAQASMKAKEAIETGDAELAAEAALECQEAAMASNEFIQKEIQKTQDLKQRLTKLGVKVEVLKGSQPIDVMKHLGKRSGYNSVVWRAGCWGNRGVDAILTGAYQWVSAHLAVDAIGGKFWQLMLAERALQSACGHEREIKVYAEQDDINLEYCDREDADKDCNLLFDGRPVRHVRLDARVAVIDDIKRKEQTLAKTVSMKKFHEEEAPWFI